MQPGDSLTNPADFIGPLLIAATIVVVLAWYIIFVQNRRR